MFANWEIIAHINQALRAQVLWVYLTCVGKNTNTNTLGIKWLHMRAAWCLRRKKTERERVSSGLWWHQNVFLHSLCKQTEPRRSSSSSSSYCGRDKIKQIRTSLRHITIFGTYWKTFPKARIYDSALLPRVPLLPYAWPDSWCCFKEVIKLQRKRGTGTDLSWDLRPCLMNGGGL